MLSVTFWFHLQRQWFHQWDIRGQQFWSTKDRTGLRWGYGWTGAWCPEMEPLHWDKNNGEQTRPSADKTKASTKLISEHSCKFLNHRPGPTFFAEKDVIYPSQSEHASAVGSFHQYREQGLVNQKVRRWEWSTWSSGSCTLNGANKICISTGYTGHCNQQKIHTTLRRGSQGTCYQYCIFVE
jgi:hypothetical protein